MLGLSAAKYEQVQANKRQKKYRRKSMTPRRGQQVTTTRCEPDEISIVVSPKPVRCRPPPVLGRTPHDDDDNQSLEEGEIREDKEIAEDFNVAIPHKHEEIFHHTSVPRVDRDAKISIDIFLKNICREGVESKSTPKHTNIETWTTPAGTRRQIVDQMQQFRQTGPPKKINKLCSIYCMTGSCTSICSMIHDPEKVALCQNVLKKQPCPAFNNYECKLSHDWNYHVAPSCLCYTMGFCSIPVCTYAHNSKVSVLSNQCEQFRSLAYCEQGPECDKIHLAAAELPEMILQLREEIEAAKKKQQSEVKLIQAREKAKRAILVRNKPLPLPLPLAIDSTAIEGRRLSSSRRVSHRLGTSWASAVVEEIHGGEKAAGGEFANQEDFISF